MGDEFLGKVIIEIMGLNIDQSLFQSTGLSRLLPLPHNLRCGQMIYPSVAVKYFSQKDKISLTRGVPCGMVNDN